MKTPEEKYNNDPEYCGMVDSLVSYIEGHKFTPSEMREMVMFACIRYEQLQTKKLHFGRLISTPLTGKSWFERQCMGNWNIEPIRPIDDKGPRYARNYIPTILYQPFYVHDISSASEPTVEEKINFSRNWREYRNKNLPMEKVIAYAKNIKSNCLLNWLVKHHYIQEVKNP